MRRPTTQDEAYAWHRAALAGERPPVHEGHPQCGWYRRRLVKDGPWVPARIWLHQVLDPETGELAEPEAFVCEVNGEDRMPYAEWTWLARHPISEGEFDRMTAAIERAGSFDPMNPILQPERPVDLTARVPLPGGQ